MLFLFKNTFKQLKDFLRSQSHQQQPQEPEEEK